MHPEADDGGWYQQCQSNNWLKDLCIETLTDLTGYRVWILGYFYFFQQEKHLRKPNFEEKKIIRQNQQNGCRNTGIKMNSFRKSKNIKLIINFVISQLKMCLKAKWKVI